MITLHSIDLKTIEGPCFASIGNEKHSGCRILHKIEEKCGTYKCPFYKPKGCRDWVRIDDRQGSNIIPPEEYEQLIRRKHE